MRISLERLGCSGVSLSFMIRSNQEGLPRLPRRARGGTIVVQVAADGLARRGTK